VSLVVVAVEDLVDEVTRPSPVLLVDDEHAPIATTATRTTSGCRSLMGPSKRATRS